MNKIFLSLLGCSLILGSCTSVKPEKKDDAGLPASPRSVNKSDPLYKNPYPANTYNHFVARKDYPKTYDVFYDNALLAQANGGNSKVVVSLKEQRARLYVNGKVGMDWPVCTGVRSRPTPAGSYKVLGKEVKHASNRYGRFVDASGKTTNGDADAFTETPPEGGAFVGSPMPYWQRLTNCGVGLHVGKVGRSPRSHGCIRMPKAPAEKLFRITSVGTPVIVTNGIEDSSGHASASDLKPVAAVNPPVPKKKPVAPKPEPKPAPAETPAAPAANPAGATPAPAPAPSAVPAVPEKAPESISDPRPVVPAASPLAPAAGTPAAV
ncbi:L,D-transpeptidase family protein [Akkermansia glycaniphila]|uniref:L,D-transpeptidase family protein n=1 Tax=Akkermansia glycaniphila TaxID=1679444 RepID=UPI001C00FF36|nr:L,D-transpeptidase family protein [Akkermansia glycaniphila]MBT9450854.1 L,D-transpeptidase family protein [Akkermansia glycaniphila]